MQVYYRVKVAGQFNLQISLANDSKAKHTVFEGHVIVCPVRPAAPEPLDVSPLPPSFAVGLGGGCFCHGPRGIRSQW